MQRSMIRIYLENIENEKQAAYPCLQSRRPSTPSDVFDNREDSFQATDSSDVCLIRALLALRPNRKLGYQLHLDGVDFSRHQNLRGMGWSQEIRGVVLWLVSSVPF